jgi:spermidine synthase
MKFMPKDMELVKKVESRYGEIKVLKIRNQMNVYSSGKFDYAYPDTQTEEIRAHMPVSVHPSPERILIIGGSPAVLRGILKYPPIKTDFLEIDPKMIDVSLSLLSKEDRIILNDKRLKIIPEDARKFLKRLHGPYYDMVILNLPEPATANINRFYTEEFFHEAKKALKKDGILSLTLSASSGYIGRRMQTVNGSVYNSVRSVFGYTAVSSEEYGYVFASDSHFDVDPALLETRFDQRMIKTENFRPYIFHDAFSTLKTEMVKERLGKISSKNKDMRPSAYLYNLMLWADIQGSNLLMPLLDYGRELSVFMVILIIASSVLLWRRNKAVYYSIFTTGYSAMAFSVMIILFYQAAYGYVYEMIGLLTSMFMAGTAFGAYIMRSVSRPMKWLRLFEAVTILLFISSPLFFRQEALFYVLNMFCGITGGIQFTLANQFLESTVLLGERHDTAGTAGRLYAFELGGSFLGALLTSIFLMPIFGLQNTIIFVVLIKAVSLVLLFSIRHEKD